MNQVQTLSQNDEWYTPIELIKRFGKFDYDPATTPEKAQELGVITYDTVQTDGLRRDWAPFKRIWINPPFSRKEEFLQKAVETFKLTKNEILILLPIQFLTTKVFHRVCDRAGVIYLPNGRISFEDARGLKRKSPSFGSVIMRISDHWELKILDLGGKNEN